MTDSNIQHLDLDSEEFDGTPRALREYARKLQEKVSALEKTNATLQGRVTDSALGDVLKQFKNPGRVKRDLTSDGIDPLDEGAVKKWLADNADDYAKGDGAATQSAETVPAEEVAAHEAIAGAATAAQPADMSKFEAAKAEITPTMTGAEVAAIYAKHGL